MPIANVLYKRGFSRPYLGVWPLTKWTTSWGKPMKGYAEITQGRDHWSTSSYEQGTIGLQCKRMPNPTWSYVKNANTSAMLRQPSEPLTLMNAPWPFTQWGLDIIGPLPIAIRQLKFLVMGINYFIKWVEAEPLAIITEKNVYSFVWKSIIYQFRIPRVLVSNNGKLFNNDAFKNFCNQLGIKNHYSSPAHPQANGQVKVINRSLLKLIKTRLERIKGIWPDKLPSVL